MTGQPLTVTIVPREAGYAPSMSAQSAVWPGGVGQGVRRAPDVVQRGRARARLAGHAWSWTADRHRAGCPLDRQGGAFTRASREAVAVLTEADAGGGKPGMRLRLPTLCPLSTPWVRGPPAVPFRGRTGRVAAAPEWVWPSAARHLFDVLVALRNCRRCWDGQAPRTHRMDARSPRRSDHMSTKPTSHMPHGEGPSRHRGAEQHGWSPDVDSTHTEENPSARKSSRPRSRAEPVRTRPRP